MSTPDARHPTPAFSGVTIQDCERNDPVLFLCRRGVSRMRTEDRGGWDVLIPLRLPFAGERSFRRDRMAGNGKLSRRELLAGLGVAAMMERTEESAQAEEAAGGRRAAPVGPTR